MGWLTAVFRSISSYTAGPNKYVCYCKDYHKLSMKKYEQKNAKNNQNMFFSLQEVQSVMKLLSEIEQWTVKLIWPKSATIFEKKLLKWQKMLPNLEKSQQ